MILPARRLLLAVSCSLALPLAAQNAGRRWIVADAASLAEAQQSSKAGDTIVLRAPGGPYRGPVALKSGQSLIGEDGTPVLSASEGAAVTVADAAGEVVLANLAIRGEGKAQGLAVAGATGVVTLRDVSVSTNGGTGIAVTNAARFVVKGASSVAAVDAAAVEISRADLDVAFRTVSARGERLRRGIALENTKGRFVVEGGTIDGAAFNAVSAILASGMTLRGMTLTHSAKVNGVPAVDCGGDLTAGKNKCSAAVFLRGARSVVLDGIVIDGSGQAGVAAYDVNNFSLLGSTIREAGDELFEHGLVLQEISGDLRIASTKFERSASRHVMLYNSDGTLKAVIEKCSFTDTVAPNGQQAVLVTAAKGASIDLQIRDNRFARIYSNAVDLTASDAAKVSLLVSGNTFSGQASAVNVSATGGAVVNYVIADNPSITGSTTAAINLYLGTPSSGKLSGTIARNAIGKSGAARSGAACNSCSGISLSAAGEGSLISAITGNTLLQTGGAGLVATAGPGSPRMAVTITANRFGEPANVTAPAIRVSSSGTASDTSAVCADIGGDNAAGNVIEGAWEPGGPIQLLHRFGGARFQIAGLTGGSSDAAAAAAVSKRNRGSKVRAVLRPDTQQKGFEPALRCTMPSPQ
jgi:hypothetical protein